MDITPAIAADRHFIDGYGPGLLRVKGIAHATPLLVFPGRVLEWKAELRPEAFAPVFEAKPDVLLLGVGATFSALPPPALRQAFKEAHIVLEAMETGAACRTYNVLLSEGRSIAAALVPI